METKEYLRPKTTGELLAALMENIDCEVVGTHMEITNIYLDGWLNFEGEYQVNFSPNKGWVIYSKL